MNHKMAVPFLKVARTAWESDSRWETYLAVGAGTIGAALLAREAWQLKQTFDGGQ
mgnify:CR=1 FL=1|jgi:hypothetical protein